MKWLVDGHNLIGQMPNLHLDDRDDEEKLLEQLRRYRARTGHRLTVVFDPGQGYRPGQTKKQGGLTIQFAPSGKTADQIIIRRLRRIRDPQAVTVVSSDRAVQRVARQMRVRVLDSREFAGQLFANKSISPDQDAGSRADVCLAPDEVDEWLNIFNQADS